MKPYLVWTAGRSQLAAGEAVDITERSSTGARQFAPDTESTNFGVGAVEGADFGLLALVV